MRARFVFVAILCIGAGAFAAWHAHGRQPPPAPAPEPEEPLGPIRLAPRYESPPPARPTHVASTGHLTVRVVDEAGQSFPFADDFPILILNEGDQRRQLDDPVEEAWTVELAPGAYTVDAYTGTLVGTTGPMALQPGEDRTIAIRLVDSAHFRGRVDCPPDRPELCEGWHVELTLTNQGERQPTLFDDGDEATFDLNGFLPGRNYDLVFSRAGSRPTKLMGITAPMDNLVVHFDSLPSLRGAIGVVKGDPCPANEIRVTDADGDQIGVDYFDQWCRFQIRNLPATERLHLEVPGLPELNRTFELPQTGEPPFLCLSGGCAEPRPEDLATLEIILDKPDAEFVAIVRYATRNPGYPRFQQSTGQAVVTDLESGVAVNVDIPFGHCATQHQTVQLGPGINRAFFPCPVEPGD